MVFRVYVEKKPGFDVEAQQLGTELKTILGIDGLRKVRIVNRYDVEGISQELFEQATPTVFSEPQVDDASANLPDFGDATVFATEFLPGQFDQRADSAAECIQLISQGERPTVRSAKVYALEGTLSEADVDAIKHYVIDQPCRGPRGVAGSQDHAEDPGAHPRQGRDHRRLQRDGRRCRPEVHRRARARHGSGRS